MTENTSPKGKQNKKDRSGFDRVFTGIMLHTVVPLLKAQYGVKRTEHVKTDGEPFIVLFNHTTDLDMAWIMDAFGRQIYCLGSEHIIRFPLAGVILNTLFAPILIKKGSNGMAAVMEMNRYLRSGRSILMSPEGVRSGNGRTCELVPSTAAVLKKLRCNIITVRIHGGYLTTPRWGKGVRKGEITVEKIAEYSKESIASMDAAEFHKRIEEDLYEDAYVYNDGKKIRYRGKNKAEGIETQLYLCPSCRRLATMKSAGDTFFCDCGLKGSVDEYGLLSGEGFTFRTVAEWDDWQEETLAGMIREIKTAGIAGSGNGVSTDNDISTDNGVGSDTTDRIIVSSPALSFKEISAKHKETVLAKGDLSITSHSISVGEKTVEFTDLSGVSIISYGILLLSTKDKHYYEISRKNTRYPGILYLKLISGLKED